jgi:hypothetical protein
MQKGYILKLLMNSLSRYAHVLMALSSIIFFNFTPPPYPNEKLKIETIDHVIVVKNNSVVFDYLEQADIKDPVQIRVIDKPKFGEVRIEENNSFKYEPTPDLCDLEDQFTYLINQADKSIKVVVSIEILCETLTIINGISTDKEEEALKYFKIIGIENFPNNTLHIFDNEGNEIYAVNGYQNDWNGNYLKEEAEQEMIAENLYYYVFNDGNGNYYSGYLNKF